MPSPFSHVRLFAALWTVARQAPLSMGISRQESWSRGLCPPLVDLPNPGIERASLKSPALGSGFFTASTTWEASTHTYTCFCLVSKSGLTLGDHGVDLLSLPEAFQVSLSMGFSRQEC